MELWNLSDEKLLKECRFEAFVGKGPGGQKRNKTNAAVRLTHVPTGISAIAQESRSQRENKIHALRRMRHKIAMEIRHEIDPINFRVPEWFHEYEGLRMSEKNPFYPATVAAVLDVLKAMGWEVSRAAVMLGITTSALVRFLHDDPPVWERVNRIRGELGLEKLRR